MNIDLALIWGGIISFAVLTYMILDGFGLGIGILFPFASQGTDQDLMMNSVAPVWDGNKTWLIIKTEGGVQSQMRRYSWFAAVGTLVL